MKKFYILPSFLFAVMVSFAQVSMEEVGSGLIGPIGIEADGVGNLWVAESGSGQDDAGVSVLWTDGTQSRVITDLPSVFDTATMENLGAQRVQFFNDQYVGVMMSEGAGIYSSAILVFARDSIQQGGTALQGSDAEHIIRIEDRVLQLGIAESNAFSFVHDGSDLFIADAAANSILRRDGLTGVINVFATFPATANPLPFGPPFFDPVPTRIVHNPAGGFYVSELTGFPFIDGASDIYAVSEEGDVTVVDSNLTLITDLSVDPGGDGLIALQYAQFRGDSVPPFVIGSAMLTHLHTDGSRDTLASGFGPSPGFAIGEANTYYVTNLFFGTVTKISMGSTTSATSDALNRISMEVFPNPIAETIQLSWQQNAHGPTTLRLYALDGKLLASRDLGAFAPGKQSVSLSSNTLGLNGTQTQNMVMSISSNSTFYSTMIMKIE